MKFGKEFASQMVPEWKEAYMDYTYLKSLLKQILHLKRLKKPDIASSKGLNRKMTLYRAFSGLTRRYSNSFKSTPHLGGGDAEEQTVILVNTTHNEETDATGNRYETMFLMSSDEGGEHEVVYFKRLDDEFNKVVKFYEMKVEEVMSEAVILSKQMDALIAFRIKVEDPEGSMNSTSVEMDRLKSVPETASSATTGKTQTTAREGRVHMDVIDEIDQHQENNLEYGNDTTYDNKSNTIQPTRPAPLDILNHVRLNNSLETPRSTLKGILKIHSNTELQFKQQNLKRIEENLKIAFVEFYQKLRVLKSYSFLNVLAFSKIMKKYDKITSRSASKSYMKMVDNSYLGSSDEVNKLIERVEATFIKHFANANHSKGIRILRPTAKKERHRITYALGFLSGCTAALFLALVLLIHARKIIGKKGTKKYMENLFPLYSLFGFIVLHMIMYGLNIVFWKRYRVHYTFIFGFKQGTELGYREVFLLSTALATLALASVLSNLDMEMEEKTQDYKALTELVPLGLVALVICITVCPFNIIYRSSRFFLLTCAFHCLCAPLYKVSLSDFFLADQLTSQVQAIRSLEFYVCYYGWGDFTRRDNNCQEFELFIIFNFIIATIPYVWRVLQCLRRLFEEKDAMQGYNALKYLSTIWAVCMRTAYSRNDTFNWKVMVWTSSVIAAVVSTYWDLVIDWGLLQRDSKNPWLRDKLLVSNKFVYFGAMVLNVLLRLAWMQTVLRLEVPFLHTQALITIVACLEIIRRGIWNFFRLENEHLNNVGKYRAFKSVPLPFNYHEDGEKAK